MTILKLAPHHIFNATHSSLKKGFTLLEVTVVMVVMLTLIGVGFSTFRGYNNWKKGAEAGTRLRSVHSAQLTYLAENPTLQVASLTMDDIIPYLANGGGFLTSTVTDPANLTATDIFILDLSDNALQIKVDKSPPYITGNYDPSGKTDDGQWDTGN